MQAAAAPAAEPAPAPSEADRAFLEAWRAYLAEVRQGRELALAGFAAERAAELGARAPAVAKLAARLRVAARPEPPPGAVDARVAGGDALVAAALAALWRDAEARVRAAGDWPELLGRKVVAHLGGVLSPVLVELEGHPFRDFVCALVGLEQRTWQALSGAPGIYTDEVLAWRVRLAYHWAALRPACEVPTTFRAPAALVVGDGAPARLFGKCHDGFGIRKATSGGALIRFEISAGRAQLDLYHPELLTLSNPLEADVVRAMSQVLTNRAWRMLLCCFAAATEDADADRSSEGAFLYTPSRFADMLGYRRERKGRAEDGRAIERHTPDRCRAMDAGLLALARAWFRATVKKHGRDYSIVAERLVYYAHAKVSDGDGANGRRTAALCRINDALLGLLRGEGAWFLNVPIAALKTPAGVDPRTWDDAFKIYTLLAAHARTNARDAKSGKWTRSLDGLLADANISGPEVAERKQRARALALLGELRRAGLLAGFSVRGKGPRAMVVYELHDEQRRDLAAIPPRRDAKAAGEGDPGKPGAAAERRRRGRAAP